MRERITKNGTGRGNFDRKEVTLRINESGVDKYKKRRYVLAIRFTPESVKKVSDTGYVVPEIDRDMHRMYFVSATSMEGFKLTKSSKNGVNTSFSFRIDRREKWESYVGDYDLKKDVHEGIYYIDLPN